jgi:hypothetical protein
MKRKNIIARMQKQDPEEHIAISEWCAEEVLSQAKKANIDITEAEANKLIDSIHTECAGGTIDWDVITDALFQFNTERKKENMRKINTFKELEAFLNDTALFSETESKEITKTCGFATVGNAIIACETIGIELTGSDIDELITCLIK